MWHSCRLLHLVHLTTSTPTIIPYVHVTIMNHVMASCMYINIRTHTCQAIASFDISLPENPLVSLAISWNFKPHSNFGTGIGLQKKHSTYKSVIQHGHSRSNHSSTRGVPMAHSRECCHHCSERVVHNKVHQNMHVCTLHPNIYTRRFHNVNTGSIEIGTIGYTTI